MTKLCDTRASYIVTFGDLNSKKAGCILIASARGVSFSPDSDAQREPSHAVIVKAPSREALQRLIGDLGQVGDLSYALEAELSL